MVDCEFFHIVDWDMSTGEIYHAVCTEHNPTWPNCNQCKDRAEYRNMDSNPVLISSAKERLLDTDAELLGKSPDAMVRQEPADNKEVKRLYDIWKSL